MVKKIFKIVRLTLALLFASSLLAVVAYRFVPVYFTPLMLTRCFEQIADGRSVRLHHEWIPLERMARSMPVAVIASEDQRFMEHHGFDYKAIEQAALEHLDDGKRLRGIYGVEAVAEQHFGINAYNLTRADCALIAATLPNPRRYSSKTPSPYMRKRQRQIMHQMTFIPAFDMRR